MSIKVTIWNEFVHELESPQVAEIYPHGIHQALADFLGKEDDFIIRTATLREEEHGLTQELLDDTDVLIWWGHIRHHEVSDQVVDRVVRRVREGMGFIPLHSAHLSKPFVRLMGTSCCLRWHEEGEKERVWVIEPSHPIAKGLPPYFEIPQEEMYGERFDIPAPDRLIFTSWFQFGEVFRSGCCFMRSYGRIFYFQPGHETYPTYHIPEVQKVIINAVRWAAPAFEGAPIMDCEHVLPLEPLT